MFIICDHALDVSAAIAQGFQESASKNSAASKATKGQATTHSHPSEFRRGGRNLVVMLFLSKSLQSFARVSAIILVLS